MCVSSSGVYQDLDHVIDSNGDCDDDGLSSFNSVNSGYDIHSVCCEDGQRRHVSVVEDSLDQHSP